MLQEAHEMVSGSPEQRSARRLGRIIVTCYTLRSTVSLEWTVHPLGLMVESRGRGRHTLPCLLFCFALCSFSLVRMRTRVS